MMTSLGDDWSMIEAQLPSDWRELVQDYEQVGHAAPHLPAKLNDPAILLRLVLYHVAVGMSLKSTVAAAAAAGSCRAESAQQQAHGHRSW